MFESDEKTCTLRVESKGRVGLVYMDKGVLVAAETVGQLNEDAVYSIVAWDDTVVTSQATYTTSDSKRLTGVTNVANIEIGSLVTGAGVGREVYVKSKNVGAQDGINLLRGSCDPLMYRSGLQSHEFNDTEHRVSLIMGGVGAHMA